MLKFGFFKALSAALMLVPLAASAYSFTEPFSYYADRHDIKTVLTSFARSQGLTADVQPGVKGKISGRFKAVSGKDFTQAIDEAYGVGYYVLGDTIHFFFVFGI